MPFVDKDRTRFAVGTACMPMFDRNAIAAAVPVACPIAMHCGMPRTEANATASADNMRPANIRFVIFSGTSDRNGIV